MALGYATLTCLIGVTALGGGACGAATPRDDGRFRQITVSVQFFATTPSLQKILYAIESGPPYLLVENMTLRPLNAFRGFKPQAGQEPEVNVQLDAAGYALAEAARK